MRKIHNLPKLIITLFVFHICFQNIWSQDGNPYIINFELEDRYILQSWSIIQDENQIMFFANRKGILSFNGLQWDLISMPSFPLTMYRHPMYNIVYVGCDNNIGYIEKNEKGNYEFKSIINGSTLNDSIELGFIVELASYNNKLLVLSEQLISIFNIEDYSLVDQIPVDSNESFNKFLQLQDKLLVCTDNNNLYALENDTLKQSSYKGLEDIGLLLFDIAHDSNTLIGTSNNKLFVFDGKSLKEFKIKDQEYLNESILLNGISISDSSFAVSTLIGGVLVIHKKTGETLFKVSYATGLPDDEIFALGIDMNKGLWLSHDLGISRVDFSLPIRQFNSYPGLEGNLLSFTLYNNSVFVGTSESVYNLSEIKDFSEKEITIKVKPPVQKTVIQKEAVQTQPKTVIKDETPSKKKLKKSKKFLKKLKQKIEGPAKMMTSKGPTKKVSTTRKRTYVTYKKKKILELKSISHKYVKTEGLEDKCKQLVPFHNKLLVSGNNGLYEISNKKVNSVISDKYIQYIEPSTNNPYKVYVCTSDGLYILELKNQTWSIQNIDALAEESVYSVLEKDSLLWIGTDNDVFQYNSNTNQINYYTIDNRFADPTYVKEIDNEIYAFLPSKIFYYNAEKDTMIEDNKMVKELQNDLTFINSQSSAFWLYHKNDWEALKHPDDFNLQNNIYLSLFEGIENIYIDYNKNIWVIDKDNKLYKIIYSDASLYNPDLNIFVNEIKNQEGVEFTIEDLVLDYKNNSLKITLAAPFYIKENGIQYQYFVEGLMKQWSDWGSNSIINFPYIPPGEYVLHVRAKNILGNVSSEQTIGFFIKKPFWQRGWFYTIVGIIVLTLIVFVVKLRERKLQRDKQILEQKVKERTKTIEEQKDKILQQNEEITHSIQYAKRIQTAVLPSIEKMDNALPDYFVLFRPRDIVSGDFYWMAEKDEKVIIVAADCTGHGVPGAFMSMLGVSFLNEIVNKGKVSQANKILNQLRAHVKDTLSQTGKEGEAKDGMDISLLMFDFKKKIVQYSGAYNPLYIVRDGELIETKADKMPIGIHIAEKDSFTNNEIKLKKGDTLYIFSDGFIDQFGGDAGRKFMAKPFKRLLTEIQTSPMDEQKFILNETFDNWRGEYNQIDDVIIIGIRM
ncbi:SpoIIE family protein phosphatase [Bacteroidota bacterium]